MASQQQTAVLSVFLNGDQAKSEIATLEQKAKNLKEEIKKAAKEGDKALEKDLKKQLSETNKTVRALESSVVNVSKVLNNLSSAKPKELRQTLNALQKQLQFSDIERGSQRWNVLQENIRRVKLEMKNISAESAVAESSLSRLSNGFNKYFGMITTFIASVTGLSFAFRKLAEDVAKMDDVYADVMKTTGMTKEEVKALNEEFKKMNTRTSREELNLLARDAGKLGLTARKDILDFVEAGNQIRVALGEDLGEDAIKNIGKMVAVYKGASETLQGLDLKEQMLAVGSAVNQLGASSTASEPYLVAFAGRLGGVAKQAGISMDAVLGFASALDQDMQAVEMSATALQNFIMKMMGDPAKFAKLAGLEVKSFAKLLRTDANTAIKQVLQSLNEKGGFQELIPVLEDMGLSGARAVGVLSAMAGSIDKIDEAQRIANEAMTEGVSVTNEYDIKNNNLMARLEKAKKKFKDTALELGEKLNPALLHTTNLTTMLIKVISSISDWLSKYGGVIVKTTSAIALYTVAVNASVIADKLKVFWTDKIVASLQRLWATMLKNPWGVFLAAGTLLLSLYQSLNKEMTIAEQKQRALDDVSKTAQKNIARETAMLNQLLKVARDENRSQEERLKAIKKLNEISPEHLGNLALETINTNKAKIAIDNYKTSLLDAAMAKAAFDKIVELQQQKLNLESKTGAEIYSENVNLWKKTWVGIANTFGDTGYFKSVFNQAYKERQDAIKGLDEQIEALTNRPELKNSVITPEENSGPKEGDTKIENGITYIFQNGKWIAQKTLGSNDVINNKIKEYDRLAAIRRIAAMQTYKDQETFETELLRIEEETIKKKQALYKQDSVEYIKYQEELEKIGLKTAQNKEKQAEVREKAINNLIEKYQKQATKTEEQKKADELAALDEFWGDKIEKTEQYWQIFNAIQDKYDPEKKENLNTAKQLLSDNPEATNKKKDLSKLDNKDLDAAEQAEIAALGALMELHDAEIDEIINYEELVLRIEEKYRDIRETNAEEEKERKIAIAKLGLESMSELLGAASNYLQASLQADEVAVNKRYDAEIKAAGNNQKKVQKLEEEKQKELSKMRAEAADKSFGIQVAMSDRKSVV